MGPLSADDERPLMLAQGEEMRAYIIRQLRRRATRHVAHVATFVVTARWACWRDYANNPCTTSAFTSSRGWLR